MSVWGFCAGASAAAITLSGALTESGSALPLSGIEVGFTRTASLPAGNPGDTILIEATAFTNGSGVYSLSIDDTTPDLDRVLVFTRTYGHFNELYDGATMDGRTPTHAETASAGVVEVDFRTSVSGINFILDPNGASKTTYMLAMRDGSRLATDVYLPAGAGPWPVLLYRTPYGKDTDNASAWPTWTQEGWAVVSQDCRGAGASEDIFRGFYDDGWGANQDGYDTAAWIVAQSWCNGNFGTLGASARGITQNSLAGSLPPGLVCQHIDVAASNLYAQAMFQGGSFRKALAENWMDGQGPAARAYLENEIKTRPLYDETYWPFANFETRHALVDWPIVNVGGWYDIFLQGTINNFTGIQHNGQPGADGNQKLIIGPYGHGNGDGGFDWPSNAANPGVAYASERNWLDYWIKGIENGVMDDPAVAYYVLGDVDQPEGPGNEWRYADDWPVPATEVKFYLHEEGGLDTVPPDPNEVAPSFLFDPNDPVPTLGGANLTITRGPYDQASLENRSDVLVFTTDTLTEEVEITGKVLARLFASSTAVDTDFTAKLCDVYPDGRSMLVCDGIIRARHRNSQETEEFLTPGAVYEFEIDLWETCIVFAPGHRIRVDISSSNYPRFDVNPNTGEPFNEQTALLPAANTIYLDRARPSHLLVRATGPDADENGLPDIADRDGDSVRDESEWRIIHYSEADGFETLEQVLPGGDFDLDGLTNIEESQVETNPTLADSDSDGINDGSEVNLGSNPHNLASLPLLALVHVDFSQAAGGLELGTLAQPFNSFEEALLVVDDAGEIVLIGPSATSWTGQLGSPLRLSATGAAVRIGAP